MKKLAIVLAIIFMASTSYAAQVTMAWDHPGADGYAIFQRHHTQPAYGDPLWEGPEKTCTVTVPDDRESAYVARAFVYGVADLEGNVSKIWSGDSNEIVYVPPAPPQPESPTDLVIQALQALINWFEAHRGM